MAKQKPRPVLPDYSLELLLDYDGQLVMLDQGYTMRFEISRCKVTPGRPHGIRYSLTLHDDTGKRILGFDNAHAVPATRRERTRMSPMHSVYDHLHKTAKDKGRPYRFIDAAKLLTDYFDAVERELTSRGIPFTA